MESLTINRAFAAKYKRSKETEELSKLRDLHGDVSSSDSSSESEDEEGAWSNQTESDFLRTLSLLKKKDPLVYDKNTTFFSAGERENDAVSGSQQTKAMYLRDYERVRLLEKGSKADLTDSEEEDDNVLTNRGPYCGSHTYQEEQEEIKDDLKKAFDEDGKGEDQVLTLRVKTNTEKVHEEIEYEEWLRKNAGNKDLDTLRSFWADPGLEEGEQFLRDYIIGQGHRDISDITVPMYNELVGEGSEVDSASDSEDEEALEEQEDFEKRFNFRFEEPDGDLIKSYPRTIANSVRTADDSRKQKRMLKQERLKEVKEREQEEMKRLKNLKRKEFQKRLEKVAEVTGNSVDSLGVFEHQLDEDFDPESYDQSMEALFGTEYYEKEEDSKPGLSCDNDVDYLDPLGVAYDSEGVAYDCEGPFCDDPDFNMDADYEPAAHTQQMTSKMKRKKKLTSHGNMTSDPNNSSKHIGNKYKPDPLVREGGFKYRGVVANDFGLSTDEILLCENRELNSWVSLAKMVQYRDEDEEQRDCKLYRKRGRNRKRKRRCLSSIYAGEEVEEDKSLDDTHSKKSGNKQGHSSKDKGHNGKASDTFNSKSKKKSRAVMCSQGDSSVSQLSSARLKSYGML